MAIHIGRRKFIATLAGGTALWPLAAHAQQSAMPVVGFLGLGSAAGTALRVAGFRRGLGETSYVEGQNVAIEYRWSEGKQLSLPWFNSASAACWSVSIRSSSIGPKSFPHWLHAMPSRLFTIGGSSRLLAVSRVTEPILWMPIVIAATTEGRKAYRIARASINQVRVRHQPQDRHSARYHIPATGARHC
jgi:hypothetical protein